MSEVAQPPAAVRWPARAGAWLGIGTSPAALVMGAGLAARHEGAVPVIGIVLGAGAMATMLAFQGRLGLRPPLGEGGSLALVTRRYLAPRPNVALQLLLGGAMVGWFAFNVGLGGAGLGAVLGLPQPGGQVLLAAPIAVVALGGLRRWNALAVATTVAAVVLVALVVVELAAPGPPVTLAVTRPLDWIVDVTAFIGYGAVFALRAPDFSDGLATRRDLAWCVALLVGSVVLVALAGAALYLGTLEADVVSAIAVGDTAQLGNTLIAVSVVAATFTTLHSGSLALAAATGWPTRWAMGGVLLLGTALAAVRFDRYLLDWLSVLSVVLPAFMVPLAVAASRRQRGGTSPKVRPSMWVPGSVVGVALLLAGLPGAAFASLAVAGIATWLQRGALRAGRADAGRTLRERPGR